MKKIFLFLAVASTTMFVSCSDDDENSTDKNAATSIVLAANVASIEVGQSVTFTVTDNNALVVTGSSTILANNVEINGATFTPTAAGSYAVKAVHTNSNDVVLESNTVTITVTSLPARYIKYNGTVINASAGDMIYWGAYYTDASQTDVVELFALATHDGDLAVESPNNLAFVDFSIPVVDNQGNTVVAGTYDWVSPFTGLKEIQLKVSNAPVAITTYNTVAINISSITFGTAGALTMKYTTQASFDGKTLNTAGDGSGFIFDASEKNAGKTEVFNLAKFNAGKAKFLASNVKVLKK